MGGWGKPGPTQGPRGRGLWLPRVPSPAQVRRGLRPPEGAGGTLPVPRRTHAGTGPAHSSPRRIGPETSRRCHGGPTTHGHTRSCTASSSLVRARVGRGVLDWCGLPRLVGTGRGQSPPPQPGPASPATPPPVLQKLKAGEGGLVRALEAYPPYLWKLGSCSQHGPQLTPDHSFEQRWLWGGVCGVNLLPPQYAGPSEFPRLL